jgi:hypothetical protein
MDKQDKTQASGNSDLEKDRSKKKDQLHVDQLDKSKQQNSDNSEYGEEEVETTEGAENETDTIITDPKNKDRPDPGTPLAPPQPDLQQE